MTLTTRPAIITGITGQNGTNLAELLLENGYEIHGIKRRSSLFNSDRIDYFYQNPHETERKFILHHDDLTNSSSLIRIIQQVQPDEIYNLAAQSHVAVSFEEPEYTANSDALSALRILCMEKKTRLYQASTSELYCLVQETPQKETTPFYPRSPYAVTKLYACNGFLFNHEPSIRGEAFVTHNITHVLCQNQARPPRLPLPWQHGCQTRLEPRPGRCGDTVADAEAAACRFAGKADAWKRNSTNSLHPRRTAKWGCPSSPSTRATSVPPKSKPCWTTRPRPSWAESQRSASTNSWPKWSKKIPRLPNATNR